MDNRKLIFNNLKNVVYYLSGDIGEKYPKGEKLKNHVVSSYRFTSSGKAYRRSSFE